MLKPLDMTRIVVAAPKSYQMRVISKLYDLNVLHITEHVKTDELDIGRPFADALALSETLVKIRSLLSIIPKDMMPAAGKTPSKEHAHIREQGTRQIIAEVYSIHIELTSGVNSIRELEAKIKDLKAKSAKLALLAKFGLDIESISGYSNLAYFVGYAERTHELKREIEGLEPKSYVRLATVGEKSAISIFTDLLSQDKIKAALEKYKFHQIDFTEFSQGLPTTSDKLSSEIEHIEKKADLSRRKLHTSMKKHADYLKSAQTVVAEELEKSHAPLKFASTEEVFIATGWIPSDKEDSIVSQIQKSVRNKAYIETHMPDHHDQGVPIKLNNPAPVNSFEMLMHLFSLPKFRELDPTFFLFLTFPLFFGFMLGDIGYGIVTLVLFIILRKAMPQFKGFMNILMFSSIASIAFGFVFGEFFGAEEVAGYHLPHLLSRAHQVMDLLVWAIILGVVHVNIGLLIGFYNELISHGFYKAVMEKLSWIVLQAAIAVGYFIDLRIGIGIGVVSIVMLWLGEGVKGLIEIPSIFSNILSYARLMALGLASVKLAEVINHFAGEMFHSGGIGILYAILLLVVGHVINIGLGIIGPFLHSLRLHYVEFFTKFFHGGGIPYSPFGRKEIAETEGM